MSKNKKIGFLIVVLLQIFSLVFMISRRVHLLNSGQEVLLQCEPVDPRSLFSGDYVILNYKISRFSKLEFQKLNLFDEKFNKNDTVYLGLKKELKTKYYTAFAVSKDIEKLKKDYKFIIRGAIKSKYSTYQIKYGVENYFVPQHKGKKIELQLKNTYVIVVISNSGESAIKKLFVNNKEVIFN